MNKAVFIDKDGTLIKDVPYNVDTRMVALEEYAGKAIKWLKENNYCIVIISNQSGIAQGFFTLSDLEKVNEEIQHQLSPYHVKIDAFYYCPHLPGGSINAYSMECDCRKPKPGLIFQAAQELNIDVLQSWMIGDILNDAEAGNRAGCKTVLINNGNETEWLTGENRTPAYIAKHLAEAAEIIIKEEKVTTHRHGKLLA